MLLDLVHRQGFRLQRGFHILLNFKSLCPHQCNGRCVRLVRWVPVVRDNARLLQDTGAFVSVSIGLHGAVTVMEVIKYIHHLNSAQRTDSLDFCINVRKYIYLTGITIQ